MKGNHVFFLSSSIIAVVTLMTDVYVARLYPPEGWSLFLARFFITFPSLLFIAILYYLVRQQEANSYLATRQRYLERIRQMEKARFDNIFKIWQESRRIRHDSRHIALLFKEYLRSGQYDEIRKVLTELQQRAGNQL